MHSYDLEGRAKIYIGLAALSILPVWLLDTGLSAINYEPQWWLSTPSFAGFYSVLYWLFNCYVWRWGFLRKLRILNVPDLNGEWGGMIQSSSHKNVTQQFTVIIMQSWSRISITLETRESRSRSNVASLKVSDSPFPELIYTYTNEPKSNSPNTMHIHRGVAFLEYKNLNLEGGYFTGRDRNTYGQIRLKRK